MNKETLMDYANIAAIFLYYSGRLLHVGSSAVNPNIMI